jgi:hypothetical protein
MVWGLYLQNGGNTNLHSTQILKLRRNLSEGLNYRTPKTVRSMFAASDGVARRVGAGQKEERRAQKGAERLVRG